MIRNIAYFISFLFIISFLAYVIWDYTHKDVLVKVGNFEVTKQELLEAIEEKKKYQNSSSINQKKILTELVKRKALLNEAKRLNLTEEPDIKRKIENLLISKVKNKNLVFTNKDLNISEKEIKNYYEENQENFKTPERNYFAILFFRKNIFDKNRKNYVIDKFKDIQNLHKNNKLPNVKKGFGRYSITHSEHQATRYRGGIIGWFSENDKSVFENELLDKGFDLYNIGDISDLVETEEGYYLIRLLDRKKAGFQDIKKVKNKIHHKIFTAKKNEIIDNFYESLFDKYKVSFKAEKLRQLNIYSDGNYSEILHKSK
jgi:hypothetical protein